MGKLYLSKLGTSGYGTKKSPQVTQLVPSSASQKPGINGPSRPLQRGAPQLQVGFFPSSHSYKYICCNHPKTCSSPRYFHKLRASFSCGTTFCGSHRNFSSTARCFETVAQAPPGLRIFCSSLDEALVLVTRDLGFGLGKAKDGWRTWAAWGTTLIKWPFFTGEILLW